MRRKKNHKTHLQQKYPNTLRVAIQYSSCIHLRTQKLSLISGEGKFRWKRVAQT